jgi:hypothetical protein
LFTDLTAFPAQYHALGMVTNDSKTKFCVGDGSKTLTKPLLLSTKALKKLT